MALTTLLPKYPLYLGNTQDDQFDIPGRTDIANAWDYNTHDAELLQHQTVLISYGGRLLVLESAITPTYALPIRITAGVVNLSYPDFLDSSVPFIPSLGMTSVNVHAAILEAYSHVGNSHLGDLDDVDTTGETKNQVLKFNGTMWVPAAYDYSFTFSIASFASNQVATQLIGAGTWMGIGAISYTATYLNGPPTAAYIALTSDGGVSWTGDLVLTTPYAAVVTNQTTAYPSAKDRIVTFTLNAVNVESSSSALTVTFRNNVKYGPSALVAWDSAAINALAGTLLSNTYTGSFATTSGAGQYIIFAHPSSYASIHSTGFIYNAVTCPFQAEALVSVTNSAGYTENYKVYRSTNLSLGNSTLVTSTTSNLINSIYWGQLTKTDSYTGSDVTSLASNAASNSKGRTITETVVDPFYIIYALPVRLGTVTFFVGGFEGGFMPPETVSVTNVNGYSENYYVYRSTNKGLGLTTVVVV